MDDEVRSEVKHHTEEKEKSRENPDNEQCTHHWVIEVANGPTSNGECKICGETREFFNAFPGFKPAKNQNDVLELPKLPKVKVKKESKS